MESKNNLPSKTWLYNPLFDTIFILSPSFISVLAVLLFSNTLVKYELVPLWAWVVFILCVDVSHVYSSLFRTYFNKKEFNEKKTLYTFLPLFVFLLGVFLYTLDSLIFWRILAYSAVFHFIRQQYGFMRLYTRNEGKNRYSQSLDSALLYTSTLYPIIYWHVNLPRNFHWFVDGDFISNVPLFFQTSIFYLYVILFLLYLIKELREFISHGNINIAKNLILFGTALSWYVGIVLFNADMIFTITNVISHGIPYMALVWAFGKKQADKDNSALFFNKFQYKVFFSNLSFPVFIITLIFLGYIEEGLWAGFVWREHLEIFGIFENLPIIRSEDTLSWLVPLLTLPQATHYVLDGFIWKLRDNESHWYTVLFK